MTRLTPDQQSTIQPAALRSRFGTFQYGLPHFAQRTGVRSALAIQTPPHRVQRHSRASTLTFLIGTSDIISPLDYSDSIDTVAAEVSQGGAR